LFPDQIGDCVLAEHPSYAGAYGPGEVVELIELEQEHADSGSDLGVTVR